MPVDIYECETWSLALNEDHRKRVFDNRVPKGEEVTLEWRKIQNEELRKVRGTTNTIRLIKSSWLG